MRFARLSLALLFLTLAGSAFAADCNTAGFFCTDLNTQIKGSRMPSWASDGGSANAYALTTIAPIGSGGVLQTGSCFQFLAANANTTASTAAIDGGSAIPIKRSDGSTALSANDIVGLTQICYDGTNFRLFGSASSTAGASTTATDLDVRKVSHGLFATCGHTNATPEKVYCFASFDGVTWTQYGGSPIMTDTDRDPSLMHYAGNWWLATTAGGGTNAGNFWNLYSSSDLITWSAATAVSVAGFGSVTNTWAPHWFTDTDGSVHIFVALSTNGTTSFSICEMHPTAADFSTWSTPVAIASSGMTTKPIDPDVVKSNGIYYLFVKNNAGTGPIELASSPSLLGTYTNTQTGNWAGWQTGLSTTPIEAPQVIQLDDGRWRIYFTNNSGLSALNLYYSETTDSTFATGWTAAAAVTSLSGYNHALPIRAPGASDILDSSNILKDTALPKKVTAGTCGDATHSCGLGYDAQGRITGVTNNLISSGGSTNFFGLLTFTAPPSTGWSWDNQGGSTINSTFGYEYANFVIASAVQMRLRYRSAPATPYTVTAAILHDISGTVIKSGNGTEAGIAIGFRNSTTGKLQELLVHVSGSTPKVAVDHWTTSTSFGADDCAYGAAGGIAQFINRQPIFIQMSDDGTNLIFRLSIDGNNWPATFCSVSRTAWFTGGNTPDQIFFGAYVNGDAVQGAVIDWNVTSP